LSFKMAFDLRLLFASDLEGGSTQTPDPVVNFAAIVEALDNENALVVSSGDNWIPGPVYNAGSIRSSWRDSGALNDLYNNLYGVDTYDSLREVPGVIDQAYMNVIGFDASAVGNHEFDAGSSAFADLVERDQRTENEDGTDDGPTGDRYEGLLFPYLSANLDFDNSALGGFATTEVINAGSNQAAAGENLGRNTIAPAAIFDVNGEQVAVIGATTPIIDTISSPDGVEIRGGGGLRAYPTTDAEIDLVTDALAAEIQPVIDEVVAQGIDKIVMLTHLQQSSMEISLVSKLTDVDVIVAGGSGDTLFDVGNTETATDDVYSATNASGDPAFVVSVEDDYSRVGQLDLSFDDDGAASITVARGIETTDENVELVGGDKTVGRAAALQDVWNNLNLQIGNSDSRVIGYTDTFLVGDRPWVRQEETTLGNLSADAQLWYVRQQPGQDDIHVSLKNGGGIRANVGVPNDQSANPINYEPPAERTEAVDGYDKPAGAISELDNQTVLRFDNNLVRVETTAAGLRRLIEHGVSASTSDASGEATSAPGQFPQVAGMRFTFSSVENADFNSSEDGQQIVRDLVIVNDDGLVIDVVVQDGELQGDPDRRVNMVTNEFLAGGFGFRGDSYPFIDEGEDPGVALSVTDILDETGEATGEQVSFEAYLQEFHSTPETAFGLLETDRTADRRIIDLASGNRLSVFDAVKPSERLEGTNRRDSITGTAAAEKILGRKRADSLMGFGGDDLLKGAGGADVLMGGGGDDTLKGGGGSDTLRGDAGADRFVLSKGTDVVSDFDIHAGDQIAIKNGQFVEFASENDGVRITSSSGPRIDTFLVDVGLDDFLAATPMVYI
jgi:2',3'-cyclic-nucleotide 2'-phosphodiesterase (5'-nucleotidase family)